MSYEIDLTEVCYALSDALDLVGVRVVQHGKRVAYMALGCAHAYGFSPQQLDDLFRASILHDCGVSSTEVHWNLISRFEWEGTDQHCRIGYELLRGCELFTPIAEMVLHHHTPWCELENNQATLPADLRLLSNCIHLADRIDALMFQSQDEDILLARAKVLETIEAASGKLFAPELVEAFAAVSEPESFWLMLESHHLERYCNDLVRESIPHPIDLNGLRAIAGIFARIVDAKSPFTAEHSTGVARLSCYLGELSGLPPRDCELLEIAGLLHDVGKLRVPDKILEKPARLDMDEFAVIERHTFETYQILRRISTFKEVAEWAAFHHETIKGKGYPFRHGGSRLSIQSRIVAVADVFQALAQNRPYRASMPVEEILKELNQMVSVGKLDVEIVRLVQTHADECLLAAQGG